jgi:hypothetical protein
MSTTNDSQNIIGNLNENQDIFKDDFEIDKSKSFEEFHGSVQISKKKNKVSFKDDNNLVTIIEVESYKQYNVLIDDDYLVDIEDEKDGEDDNSDTNEKGKKQRKKKKSETESEEIYYDKDDGNSGKSCVIY